MPISIGALVSIFFTLGVERVVTLSMMMFSEQFFVWQCGATESIVLRTLGHQLFHCLSLFFVSDFPEPSFVLVRLVNEVPEDVIKLLHVFCTITFADVADQRCTRRASV